MPAVVHPPGQKLRTPPRYDRRSLMAPGAVLATFFILRATPFRLSPAAADVKPWALASFFTSWSTCFARWEANSVVSTAGGRSGHGQGPSQVAGVERRNRPASDEGHKTSDGKAGVAEALPTAGAALAHASATARLPPKAQRAAELTSASLGLPPGAGQ